MIKRKELTNNPEIFDLDLGKNPSSTLNNLENYGVIPQSIKIGGLRGGHIRMGFYPDIVIDMIKDVKKMKKHYKYSGIRLEIRKKYRTVFEILDILNILTEFNFVKKPVLKAYLKDSTINKETKEKIHEIYCADLARKEIKLEFLDLLSTQNLHL